MNFVESFTLGVVQGLTEFLPISSTAHMNLVPALFGWPKPGAAAEAVIQLGTLVAVVAYFRKDLAVITVGFLRSLRGGDRSSLHARLGWAILLGTLPVCVIALLLEDQIDTVFRDLRLTTVVMIVMALVLWLAEVLAKHRRPLEDVQVRDGWLVGLAQAIALVPGASRSGTTLTAALFLGMERAAAARFSFLLSVPAIVLSGLYKLKDVLPRPAAAGAAATTMTWTVPDIIIATVVSGIVGYASIAFLLRFLRTHTTMVFIVYRIIAGAFFLYLLYTGLVRP